jgi:hypothetical protein
MPVKHPVSIIPFCYVYDYAVDGGAISTFNLFTPPNNSTVISYSVILLSTLTGNVASVVSFGFTSAATALFTYVIGNYGTTGNIVTGQPVITVPNANYLTMSISAFALTGGSLKFTGLISATDI